MGKILKVKNAEKVSVRERTVCISSDLRINLTTERKNTLLNCRRHGTG